MAITKEQAIDILDKFDFFQGQRAGRELWSDKPYEVQEEDIKAFSRDVAELKAYIADCESTPDKVRAEVAREIFEDLQGLLVMRIGVKEAIAELKKKYTEKKEDV